RVLPRLVEMTSLHRARVKAIRRGKTLGGGDTAPLVTAGAEPNRPAPRARRRPRRQVPSRSCSGWYLELLRSSAAEPGPAPASYCPSDTAGCRVRAPRRAVRDGTSTAWWAPEAR